MKLAIILSAAMLTGCASVYVDPCVNPPVKEKVARDPKERVYGYTKEEFAAMPSWCGRAQKPRLYDRNGRVIGYIR